MIQSSTIEDLMGGQRALSPFHDRAPEYGERSWRLSGELFDVVYWDSGNGWAWIQQVIPWEPPKKLTENNIRQAFEPSKDYARVYGELSRFFKQLSEAEALAIG